MKETIDIRPQDLEIVKAILRQHLPAGAKVYAFGSRVSWTAHAGSDLDLAVDAGRKLTLAETTALADAFEESDLPYKVDVVDWVSITIEFRELIRQNLQEILYYSLPIEERPISHFVDLIKGSVNPEEVEEQPYIGLEHIDQGTLSLNSIGRSSDVSSNKFAFRKGDTLFGKLRPYFRKVVRPNFDGVCSTDIWVIRANENADDRFVFYWFAQNAVIDAANAGSEGTKMPRAKWDIVSRLGVKICSKEKQKAIADILGALDDKIENNRQTAAKLEEMARALFQSWFVDFDPVKAKSQGKAPFGMDAETAALFPDKLVESELGLIPEGWEVGSIYTICDIVYGAPFSSELFNEKKDGLPLIRIRDLKSAAPAIFTEEIHPKATVINTGDVIAGMDAEFIPYYWMGTKAYLNQRLFYAKPKISSRVFIKESLEPLLRLEQQAQVGTTVAHVGKKDIDKFVCILPIPKVISHFAGITEAIINKLSSLSNEKRELSQLRDYLLPKLISGELRVPEIGETK